MPAHDSGISLVQTNKKAQFILYEDERAYAFRGTTSFRRTFPRRRTHHPDSSPYERPIGPRYNGLTHADLLFTITE